MSDERKTLADLQAGLMSFIGGDEAEEKFESADVTVTYVDLHPVSKIRGHRQRWAGPEANYIFRKAITVQGKGGKVRRARVGEFVDAERDGITPRRLKSLWYSEMIEVADFETSGQESGARRSVTVRNNRAIRERAAAEVTAENDRRTSHRRAQVRAREREREEQRQRLLAERAVLEAEQQEERELAQMVAEEEAAERKVLADAAILEQQARERELLAEEIERVKEEDRARAQAEAEARAEFEAAEELKRTEYLQHLEGKAERAQERADAVILTQRSDAEKVQITAERAANAKPVNPKNKQVNAKEAREDFGLGKNEPASEE